jgi:LPS-assembly lipoprotein
MMKNTKSYTQHSCGSSAIFGWKGAWILRNAVSLNWRSMMPGRRSREGAIGFGCRNESFRDQTTQAKKNLEASFVFSAVSTHPWLRLSFYLTAAALMATATGCGFHFRGVTQMGFPTVTVQAPQNSQLGSNLRRQLAATSNAQVMQDKTGAALQVEVMNESRGREVLSVNAQGRVREYTLTLRVTVRAVDAKGIELLAPTEFAQSRDISFNEGVVLAKEAEENLLYRDMQNEIVQLVLRRVAALQPGNAVAPAKS